MDIQRPSNAHAKKIRRIVYAAHRGRLRRRCHLRRLAPPPRRSFR